MKDSVLFCDGDIESCSRVGKQSIVELQFHLKGTQEEADELHEKHFNLRSLNFKLFKFDFIDFRKPDTDFCFLREKGSTFRC